jgi:hypothetical protein
MAGLVSVYRSMAPRWSLRSELDNQETFCDVKALERLQMIELEQDTKMG